MDEAVRAIRGDAVDDAEGATERHGETLPGPVPYARVAPTRTVTATATVTAVSAGEVVAYDQADDVEDWATETPVV